MSATARICLACGRRWHARDKRRFTALGIKLRRLARKRGVRKRWAHPRPLLRCPTCASTQVSVPPA